jgi:hypothetical protein
VGGFAHSRPELLEQHRGVGWILSSKIPTPKSCSISSGDNRQGVGPVQGSSDREAVAFAQETTKAAAFSVDDS